MRHQTNRKYADRKKRNRKYQSQKAYRKEQKRKTGWRARWDKFTDRLANIVMMGFLKMVSTVCGNLKIISLPYHMKMVQGEVSVIGILFKMDMSSLKMHALMI